MFLANMLSDKTLSQRLLKTAVCCTEVKMSELLSFLSRNWNVNWCETRFVLAEWFVNKECKTALLHYNCQWLASWMAIIVLIIYSFLLIFSLRASQSNNIEPRKIKCLKTSTRDTYLDIYIYIYAYVYVIWELVAI